MPYYECKIGYSFPNNTEQKKERKGKGEQSL